MAVFNPQVAPTQDPNFLNYSRSVDAAPPNMSSKIALETAGSSLESGVTLVDTAIKKGISDKAYAAVDPLRDEYTAGLEKLKSNLDQGVVPQPDGKIAQGKSLLDANASADDEPDLPSGLESGLSRIDRLAAARAAGSPRLNDTKYASDTLDVAKQLRSQFPGYREYIDQKVSQASGLPVANSYYQNMLQDINRQLLQIGRQKDDLGSLMTKNLDVPGNPDRGVPGMAEMIVRRKAGDPQMSDAYVYGRIGEWQSMQTQQKVDAANRAARADNEADKVKDVDQRLARRLNNSVTFEMSGVKDLGIGQTPQDLIKYFDDVAKGNIKAPDAEVQQKKLMFNNWVTKVKRGLQVNAGDDASVIGSKAADDRIESAMGPIYTMQKFVNSKEDGPAFYHAEQVKAIKEDALHNFLINKDYGKEATQLLTARAVLGDGYFPEYLRSMMESGTDIKLGGILKQEQMASIVPYTDTRGQPIPRYMKDAIQKGKEIAATPESGYYEAITNHITKIADPRMPLAAKDQLVDWAFNPKNVGRLDELKMDYKDPRTGQWVPGKYRAFNILASDAVVGGVAETAKIHPENYVKFQSTLEQEFGKLYRADLNTLNKVVEGRSVQVDGQGNPIKGPVTLDTPVTNKRVQDMNFSFNDANNQFGIVDKNNRPITRENLSFKDPEYSAKMGTLDVLERVNSGVRNIANVQKSNPQGPGDTPTYLLQTLQTAGFRPGGTMSGATEGMARALIKAKQPDMTPQEVDKLIFGAPGGVKPNNFATEERGPSVADFVSNPTGTALPKRPSGQVVRPEETIVGTKSDVIPAGMSAHDFIQQLKREGRY